MEPTERCKETTSSIELSSDHAWHTLTQQIHKQMHFKLIFCIFWCFASMYVCVKMLDPLELELQAVVNCHVGAGYTNRGPLEEQPAFLTTEPSLQPIQTNTFLKEAGLNPSAGQSSC